MTMYNNKLAVCIKAAGKVLREQKDQVFLPFGTEYSIFIKNLNSVRALVKVELDGKSVTDGEDLVVYGNSELNLERFLRKNNLEQGNKFKFIERKASVEAARGGIQAEDGLLRVSFQFEKVTPAPIHVPVYPKYPHWSYYNEPFYNYTQGILHSMNLSTSSAQEVVNDAGITAPGSVSDQKFQVAAWFPVETETHVIVLKLLGETSSGKVEKAVTVKHKQTCPTCKTRNRGQNKFCRECGSALELVGPSSGRVGVRG